jgi:hypothetical protein
MLAKVRTSMIALNGFPFYHVDTVSAKNVTVAVGQGV